MKQDQVEHMKRNKNKCSNNNSGGASATATMKCGNNACLLTLPYSPWVACQSLGRDAAGPCMYVCLYMCMYLLMRQCSCVFTSANAASAETEISTKPYGPKEKRREEKQSREDRDREDPAQRLKTKDEVARVPPQDTGQHMGVYTWAVLEFQY